MERFPELSEFSQVQDPHHDECYEYSDSDGMIRLVRMDDNAWCWFGMKSYAGYSIFDYESMQEAYEDAKLTYEADKGVISDSELNDREDELFARYPHLKEQYENEFGPIEERASRQAFMAGYEAGRREKTSGELSDRFYEQYGHRLHKETEDKLEQLGGSDEVLKQYYDETYGSGDESSNDTEKNKAQDSKDEQALNNDSDDAQKSEPTPPPESTNDLPTIDGLSEWQQTKNGENTKEYSSDVGHGATMKLVYTKPSEDWPGGWRYMGKIFGKNVKGNAFGDISTRNSGTYFSTPELALESLQEQDDFKRGVEIADSFGQTWDGDGVFEDTKIGEEVCNFVMGYKKLPVAQAVECISSFVEVTESGDFYEDYDDSYIRESYPDIAKKIDKIKSQKTQKNVIMWLNEMDGAIGIDAVDPAEIDAISTFCEKTKRGGVMSGYNERGAFMAGFEAGRKYAKRAKKTMKKAETIGCRFRGRCRI